MSPVGYRREISAGATLAVPMGPLRPRRGSTIFVDMSYPIPGRTVVFRGTEPAELQLVEGRLELEGLQPLRLGRVHPALAGGGNSAFQQLITVPNRYVAAAQALLDLGCVDEGELERQALAAEPLESPCDPRRPIGAQTGAPQPGVALPHLSPGLVPG